ncbi:MAG: serine/threonine protein kinase [Planctomycetota bacterium]
MKAGLLTEGLLSDVLERIRLEPDAPPLEDILLGEGGINEKGHGSITAMRKDLRNRASAELMRTLAEGAPPPTIVHEDTAQGPCENPPSFVEEDISSDVTVVPGDEELPGGSGEFPPPDHRGATGGTSLPGLTTRVEGGQMQYTEEGQPILGDYEVIQELGRGAMGVVYEAIQRSLNRRVALKILPPDMVMNEKRVRRFHLEAEAAARLDHPGIVKVFGMGEQGGIHYFAMEYIEGKTFEDLLEEGNIALRRACKLVVQACAALQYAHDQGVIHRDIKPANVMVQTDGKVRVMDFGLARQESNESSLTASGAVLGTPAYMSPEQAKGEKGGVDRRTDVYSLGATLYEMLTLASPIDIGEADGVHKILMKLMTEEPLPPIQRNPRIPLNLSTVLLKALSKDKVRRYQTVEAFGEDIERFLKGDPVEARPVGRTTKIVMKVRKHKAIAAFFILLGVTCALLPAIWVASRVATERGGAESKLREAREALDSGDHLKARGLAEFVVRTSAAKESRILAQRILLQTHLGSEDDLPMLGAAARLWALDSDGEHGRWALAQMLERLVSANRRGPALALATKMREQFPETEEGLIALRKRSELLLAAGSLNEARIDFQDLISAKRDDEFVRKNLERLLPITPIVDINLNVRSVGVGDLDGDGGNEVALAGKLGFKIFKKSGPFWSTDSITPMSPGP